MTSAIMPPPVFCQVRAGLSPLLCSVLQGEDLAAKAYYFQHQILSSIIAEPDSVNLVSVNVCQQPGATKGKMCPHDGAKETIALDIVVTAELEVIITINKILQSLLHELTEAENKPLCAEILNLLEKQRKAQVEDVAVKMKYSSSMASNSQDENEPGLPKTEVLCPLLPSTTEDSSDPCGSLSYVQSSAEPCQTLEHFHETTSCGYSASCEVPVSSTVHNVPTTGHKEAIPDDHIRSPVSVTAVTDKLHIAKQKEHSTCPSTENAGHGLGQITRELLHACTQTDDDAIEIKTPVANKRKRGRPKKIPGQCFFPVTASPSKLAPQKENLNANLIPKLEQGEMDESQSTENTGVSSRGARKRANELIKVILEESEENFEDQDLHMQQSRKSEPQKPTIRSNEKEQLSSNESHFNLENSIENNQSSLQIHERHVKVIQKKNKIAKRRKVDNKISSKEISDVTTSKNVPILPKKSIADSVFHKMCKNEKGIFHCNKCEYNSDQWRYMKTHLRRSHLCKDKQYVCVHCSRKFSGRYWLMKHQRLRHTKGESVLVKSREERKLTLACSHCEYVTNRKKCFTEHLQRRHGDKKYCCPICDRKFGVKKDLNQHLNIHSMVYQCEFCGKALKSKQGLQMHVEVLHKNQSRKVKRYLCNSCGKLCQNRTDYKIHINKEHLCVKPFKCDKCPKSFYSNASLRSHLEIHANVRIYTCEKCGKGFKQRSGLKVHRRSHLDKEERPYKCTVCDKYFTQKGALTRHMRIHTGERPYVCRLCTSSFVDYSILRRHLLGVHKIDDPQQARRLDLETGIVSNVTESSDKAICKQTHGTVLPAKQQKRSKQAEATAAEVTKNLTIASGSHIEEQHSTSEISKCSTPDPLNMCISHLSQNSSNPQTVATSPLDNHKPTLGFAGSGGGLLDRNNYQYPSMAAADMTWSLLMSAFAPQQQDPRTPILTTDPRRAADHTSQQLQHLASVTAYYPQPPYSMSSLPSQTLPTKVGSDIAVPTPPDAPSSSLASQVPSILPSAQSHADASNHNAPEHMLMVGPSGMVIPAVSSTTSTSHEYPQEELQTVSEIQHQQPYWRP